MTSAAGGCGVSAGGEPETPLRLLHARSAPLGVNARSLARGLDAARRLDALEWLVKAFDAIGLPDAHLFEAFALLDRFAAAAHAAPIRAGPGAFALVLATMIVVLKVSGTQRDLERAKRLVVEVSGKERPWAPVRKAELGLLRCLGFRACAPTALDLLERMLDDVRAAAPPRPAHLSLASGAATGVGAPSGLGGCTWDDESVTRCAVIARCLLELGIVHEPEAVYGQARPPLTAALAALLVALFAAGAPRTCAEALKEAWRLLEESLPGSSFVVAEIAESLRTRWLSEGELIGSSAPACAVAEKWLRRGGAAFAAAPLFPSELRGWVASVAQGALAKVVPSVRPQSLQAPTPQAAQATPTQAAEGPPAWAAAAPASVAKISDEPLATEDILGSPRGALQARSLQANGGAGRVSIGPPGHIRSAITAASGEPEPLIDLASVLNMCCPVPPSKASAGGVASAPLDGKLASLSQRLASSGTAGAASLLAASALRAQWPTDRRRLCLGEAGGTCREAVAALQEAAAQLLAAAVVLEAQAGAPRTACAATGCSAAGCSAACQAIVAPKRRRTFGGPSPLRATSPAERERVERDRGVVAAATAAAGPPRSRGSPPVGRLSGLRV